MSEKEGGAATPNTNDALQRGEFAAYKDEIERQLIERESRAVPIWLNVINHLKAEGWRGSRFQAALRALVWKTLSPGGAVALGVLAMSMLTAYLAWQSNYLLTEQNRLIVVQNQLQESARRAGLTVELTEVLNRVSDEQKGSQTEVPPASAATECEQKKFRYAYTLAPTYGRRPVELSAPLLGRVVALSKSFRPYRYLDVGRDTLAMDAATGLSPLSSPERAQLLMALASSNVSIEQVSKAGAEFDRAPMANATLAGLSLRRVVASYVDWNGAILVHADVEEADLRWSRLVEVNATCANFRNAKLHEADLSDGQFWGASFVGADLTRANLTIAKLGGADLSGADLRGAYTCDKDMPEPVDSEEKLRELDSGDARLKVSTETKFGRFEAAKPPSCPT